MKDKTITRKHTVKRNKTKLDNILTKKIDENVEMNDYKNLYDDYKKLESELIAFSETNEYMKNEIKLVKYVEDLKLAKKSYNEFRSREADKEFQTEFNEDDVSEIKEMIQMQMIGLAEQS